MIESLQDLIEVKEEVLENCVGFLYLDANDTYDFLSIQRESLMDALEEYQLQEDIDADEIDLVEAIVNALYDVDPDDDPEIIENKVTSIGAGEI